MNDVPLDQHVLVPRGPQAAHIAELMWFYGGIMTLVCILVWAFVLAAMLRRHERRAQLTAPQLDQESLSSAGEAEQPVQLISSQGEKVRLRWVLGFTGATVLVLFVLLFKSVATGSLLANLPATNAVQIEVVGHRWWWSARYLDADNPSNIFSTANELHIPVGRPVELKLGSADVIHSFWVPNLHGKRDLIPGHETILRLQADRAGTYRGQCAEFCGNSHTQMSMLVIAESEPEFQAWQRAQLTPASVPEDALAQRGQALFLQGPCVTCHAIAGTTAQSAYGPDLTHVASRSTLAAATLPNSRGHLAGWLLNAPNIKPGTPMPSLSVPAADLHALIAYLETLR
jgi:cytochrome c oxidase subunit II